MSSRGRRDRNGDFSGGCTSGAGEERKGTW
jgi:hypothetical protein